MSIKNHHVIRRSRIEVTIDHYSQNGMRLHHIMHQTIQQRIMPIVSRLFSQYVPHDVVIHLDKLVIDGGSFNLSTLSKHLPCQVEQMLTVQLKEQIGKITQHPTCHQVIPLPDAKRKAIAHYLSEGNFAWWMTERSEKQIEKIYLELLHHRPLLIEQLWSNMNKKAKAVQRCSTLFSRATLEHTLACLLKRPIAYFKPILAETGIVLHQASLLPNLLYTPDQQLLSMAILGIINQKDHKVDRIGFLSMLLKQVAIQSSTSYEKVLKKLHTYYVQDAQKTQKAACDLTIKALVFQLCDLVAMPPKYWYEDVTKQENVLKALDKIGNNSMPLYQLSAAMHDIKIAMEQANIRLLVKSWLQEKNHSAQLIKNLPDGLFVGFIASIDPSIVSIFSDVIKLVTTTAATIAPASALKAITLAHCAFDHAKPLYVKEIKALLEKYITNSVMNGQQCATLLTTETYSPTIKAIMAPLVSPLVPAKIAIGQNGIPDSQPGNARRCYLLDGTQPTGKKLLLDGPLTVNRLQPMVGLPDKAANQVPMHQPIIHSSLAHPTIPLSMKLLNRLESVLVTLLNTTECLVDIDALKNILVTAATVDPPATERQYMARIVDYLAPYASCAVDILCDRLSNVSLQAGYSDLSAHFSSLAPLQTQLIANQHLPQEATGVNPLSDVVDFLAYNVLPTDQLVPAYLIAKCLSAATPQQIRDHLVPLCQEATILKKLMQHATEVTLSKLLQAFVPFSHQMLDDLEKVIVASNVLQGTHQTTIRFIKEMFITAAVIHRPVEKQYIARILLHLSAHTATPPTTLCVQLMDAAKKIGDYTLVDTFSLLKGNLAPLHLNVLDEVDLIFLSTHETFDLDQAILPIYYAKLLPAIKHMIRASVELSQSVIHQLVAEHLPAIPLQETIGIALYKQITDSVQSKKDRIAQRWHLFLHTGTLGYYRDGAALLNDVIAHLSSFSLAQDKPHVRQRLMLHFTHTQLMLLVQKHSEVSKELADFIQGSYQLWSATHGALGQPNVTKKLFWDSVLKTLPHISIAQDDWLAQLTNALSNVLGITPSALLETFQCLDGKDIPEALTTALHSLQEKYHQEIQQQAIQLGYSAPLLTKLYLLLNSNLSFFSHQYRLPMATLGNELVQLIADQPSILEQFLTTQGNRQLVARRMVHYFSEEVATKLIASLAKDKCRFVMHYLDRLSNPCITTQLDDLSTWKKELCIATIHYLITNKPFEEMEFVHYALLTTCYPKEAVYRIITSIVTTKATNQEDAKVIALLKPLIARLDSPVICQPTLASSPLGPLPLTRLQEPSSKERLIEEEVRVYTKNTGLVLLWPFFYDFFKAQNLMVGNQFFCDQAAHNAVYLLQYLVTGRLKSPEWQLTLPKLLCGLSYDEVLLPYSHIDKDYDMYDQEVMQEMVAESEQQPNQQGRAKILADESISSKIIETISVHSQLLFENAITRWKGLTELKETTLYEDCTNQDILKSYFLNRLGILTRHETDDAPKSIFWHLMMMHQDHDAGNLLPPWSMTSVKLPWMQEAIKLFWMGV